VRQSAIYVSLKLILRSPNLLYNKTAKYDWTVA